MIARLALLVLLGTAVLLASACADSEPEPSRSDPVAVFRDWRTAIIDKDYGLYFDILCSEAHAAFQRKLNVDRAPGPKREQVIKNLGVTTREFDTMAVREYAAGLLVWMAGKIQEEYGPISKWVSSARLVGQPVVIGDTCTLHVSTVSDGASVEMILLREDGEWRLYERTPFHTAINVHPDVLNANMEAKHRATCMNNLRMIGAHLVVLEASGKLDKTLSGPAFLLQIATEVPDEELDIFICPGEPRLACPSRPKVGSPEFVMQFRTLTKELLSEDRDWGRYTSYAGPGVPPESWATGSADRVHLWACDRSKGGTPHHDHPTGIAVLHDTSTASFLKLTDLPQVKGPLIPVGSDSPDPRLRSMTFGHCD